MVRRAQGGVNATWHEATFVSTDFYVLSKTIFCVFSDNLAGTSQYGAYTSGSSSNSSFSIQFSQYISGSGQEFLFMTGDKTVFLITTQGQLAAVSPNAALRIVTSSSNNAAPCSLGINVQQYSF